MNDTITLRVKSITYEAEDVISLDLRPIAGGPLPVFAAGAHVELHLPNGMRRHYSLANGQTERHRYQIAVQKDPATRGGSRFIHESIRAGDLVPVEPPRNNFPLAEDAANTVLIAGGIGISPLLCMARRLQVLGRSWTLYYAVRSRGKAAFIEELAAVGPFHLHCDDENAGAVLDLAGILKGASPGTHFYCCGPLPMLAAFERAAAGLPPETVHVEYFSAREAAATGGGFEVVLARAGRTVFVPEASTILDALLAAGIDAGYSCLEGVCGSCETKVLEGIPDHRDSVLTARERESNRTVMICCSGSKTDRLVLDL